MTTKVLIEAMLFFGIGTAGLIEGVRLTLQKEQHLTYDVLGPGGFVFIISLLIIVTGAMHLMFQRRGTRGIEKAAVDRELRMRVISMIAVFAVYNLLTNYIGYLVGTIVFFLLEFRIVGVKSWLTNTVLTFVITAVYYMLFVYFCEIPFPRTILF